MSDRNETNIVVKQRKNNRLTGFQLHPENINRNGRPTKGVCLTEILKELLENQETEIGGKTFTWKEAILIKLCELAMRGDKVAIMAIFERMDGKPISNYGGLKKNPFDIF